MLAALLLPWVAPLPAFAAGRVALVVGNGAYTQTSPLANPVNDARAVGAALDRIGFDVTVLENLDEDEMDDALGEFEEDSVAADVALLFYAGHGMEMNGANYLIPVDARLASASAVSRETVALDSVLAAMAGAGTRIVILDACRNNPFVRSMRGAARANVRSGGLAAVASGEGLLVAYAAAAGDVAADGDRSENSPYTTALLEHLERPGVDVRVMLGDVGAEVRGRTGDQQPFVYSSLSGELHLAGDDSDAIVVAGENDAVVAARLQQETTYWESIEDSTNPADWEWYLERWPDGAFVQPARTRLAALRAPDPPRPGRPAPTRPDPASARPRAGEVFRDCPSCPEMVVIPAGTFEMGSPASEEGRYDDEGPQHPVTIGAFALGRYEVKREEYATFAAATGRDVRGGCWILGVADNESGGRSTTWSLDAGASWREPGFAQGANHPVTCVSWQDAKEYVAWLRRETGFPYRLASEAEWEYAARAGTTTRWYWGNESGVRCDYANGRDATYKRYLGERFGGNWNAPDDCTDDAGGTASVGGYGANDFRLFDMLGNVWEWTEDCWHGNYRGAPRDGTAWTSGGDCSRRVLRGGSWFNIPRLLRSAARLGYSSGSRVVHAGFRVARTLD